MEGGISGTHRCTGHPKAVGTMSAFPCMLPSQGKTCFEYSRTILIHCQASIKLKGRPSLRHIRRYSVAGFKTNCDCRSKISFRMGETDDNGCELK